MKSRKQKHEAFEEIKDKLGKAKITIFSSFAQAGQKGLNVSGMRELRKSLRPLDSEFTVEKKTVLDKALAKKADVFTMPGSLGIAYGYGDPFAVAKTLYQFAKKNPVFKLYGAIMGSDVLDQAKLVEMAQLPSKEILLGRLVSMLSYPMRSLAVVLNQMKHE